MIRAGGPRGNRVLLFPRPRRGRAPAAARSLVRRQRRGLRSRLPGFHPRQRWGAGDRVPRAPSTALLPFFAGAARPVVHTVPPSKKSAPLSVPPLRAPSRPRAQPEPDRDPRPPESEGNKDSGAPSDRRLPALGGHPSSPCSRPEVQAGPTRRKKKRLPAWRNFYFLL